ncbi:DUF3426 domain-containing protein [Rhizobium sp. NTR19]|uniref:DUF3426 domain-containing protein n=1 Tax=Neorhizobium turbinariae TaxID=2937795 RepID=A0ABT0ITM9_9HYPH|nr:DUF3426 domain-containing protein [Neorhizobium turbinariae]MCK8781216.1 DUF3426 domain-containing protein [Neorhizobium turbinariae]
MSTFRTQQAKNVIRMDILPPDAVGRSRRSGSRRGEVVDAQFVTVRDPRAPQPHTSHNDNRRAGEARQVQKDKVKPNRVHAVEKALMGMPADLFSAVVAFVFVVVFAAAGGFSFLFNGSSAPAETPALNIAHVTMTPQDAGGMKVLLINGVIENRSEGSQKMPAIRAELLSGEKLLTTTLISPPATAIAGGHSRGFSARVPQPGGKLPDLRLSFAEQGV